MKFKAHINIMPLKELLDPQGKAVIGGLHNLNLQQISNIRIGKHITLELDAANEEGAMLIAKNACQLLLANKVMESFEITITAE
jgi:phosphoribosylformylglycinamidine synthase PurS subunit